MSPLVNPAYMGSMRHLTRVQFDRLVDRMSEVRVVDPRTVISRQDNPLEESLLLCKGLMGRYITDQGGERRRLVALQVPGDFVDLHSFPLHRLDHDVACVEECHLAVFKHADLLALMEEDADLGRKLWALTMIDASIHRHWAFRISAMRALERIANFLSEVEIRLAEDNTPVGDSFRMPLTQAELGEACGLSTVHVNRVLRDLREDNCLILRDGRVTVLDRARMQRVGGFDPYFLYPPQNVVVG